LRIVPDEIYVNFTLQEYLDKQKEKISIDEIQKDFLDKCSKAGIGKERINIQNMNGFDQGNWYWRNRKKQQPDLLASTTYILKFTNAGEIDKLVNSLDDNSTQNMYISKTTHSRIEEYRKDVKIKALQAAKSKAQYLCESIGEKIGKTLFIQEIEDYNYSPGYKSMAMSNEMDMAAPTANEDIDFQKIVIRFQMKAEFEIE